MPKIQVIRAFNHADDVHPVQYEPGERDVSERCAEVAIAEGWARPLANKPKKSAKSGDDGQEQQPSSSPAGPASESTTSNKSDDGDGQKADQPAGKASEGKKSKGGG